MTKKISKIIKYSILTSIGAYFGWLIFNGIESLFPNLTSLNPLLQIGVGVGGIVILTLVGVKI